VHELLEHLAKNQEEDGYLGITIRSHRKPVRGVEPFHVSCQANDPCLR
jgi:hypothetical protein